MRPGPAARLSRFLVGWHPRRWRERYGEEMLEVLDQHHPTARTVASLGASAVSAHLDPAWRTRRLSRARLRRAALNAPVTSSAGGGNIPFSPQDLAFSPAGASWPAPPAPTRSPCGT